MTPPDPVATTGLDEALRVVREAADGLAALDALAAVDRALALRAATAMARLALGEFDARPAVFLGPKEEARWDPADERVVDEAFVLVHELATAIETGDTEAEAILRELGKDVADRLELLRQYVVGAADAWEYDFGAASVYALLAVLRAFTVGDLPPGEVAGAAAWNVECDAEEALPKEAHAWEARRRLREIALRDVVAAVVARASARAARSR